MNAKPMLVFLLAALLVAGCSTAAAPTISPVATPAAGGAQATATSAQAAAAGVLSYADMNVILTDSFATLPWQMQLTTTTIATGAAITGTIEVDASGNVQTMFEQPIAASAQALVDVVVITPTVYMKIDGVSAAALEVVGLQPGQWTKMSVGQDTLGLAQFALAAVNPTELFNFLGIGTIFNLPGAQQDVFKLVGTEEVNGVQANIYTFESTDSTGTTTFRIAVGVSDSRVHSIESTGPVQTTSMTMSYPSSLSITAPIP